MTTPAGTAGNRWRLARLWHPDRAALEALYLSLSPEDRRMRFCGAVSDTRIRAYCSAFDWRGDVVVGAWSDDDELIGVAELRRAPSASGERAEIALAVVPGWRRLGIGDALLRAAVALARNRFERKVYVTCLAENRPMRALAARAGVMTVSPDGEVVGRLRADWPSAFTLWSEATLDSDGIARALRRMANRPRMRQAAPGVDARGGRGEAA